MLRTSSGLLGTISRPAAASPPPPPLTSGAAASAALQLRSKLALGSAGSGPADNRLGPARIRTGKHTGLQHDTLYRYRRSDIGLSVF
eukprot:SAG22_NODE_1048_length_5851_cov_33.333449_4_plen_87_part_00